MLGIFAIGFWLNAAKKLEQNRWLLRLALLAIPAPWLASELGWFVAEFGRHPWAIGEVLQALDRHGLALVRMVTPVTPPPLI